MYKQFVIIFIFPLALFLLSACQLGSISALEVILTPHPDNPASEPTPWAEQLPATVPLRDTYFVSPNGNDNNLGSPEKPLQTIQKAANFGNGRIYVSAGTYPERVKVVYPGLTFVAQGIVEMYGFTVTADETIITGFNISTHTPSQPDGMGIYVQANKCVIENNHIHDTVRDGIVIRTPSADCVVRNNKIQHASQSGLEVQGSNNLIESNEIWDTIQYPPLWNDPPSWVDADGIRFFGSGHIIRKNYIHDIHQGVPGNIDPHIDCFQTWADNSRGGITHDITFEQNYCDNTDITESLAGKAWQIEGDAYNLTMKNNIILANLIAIIKDGHDFSFFNNTFIGAPGKNSEGIKAMNIVNLTIANNIFYYQQSGTGAIFVDNNTQGSLSSGYNCIFQAGGNRPADVGEIRDDPLFTTDYHLRANSPCIDTGANVGVNDDYDGNKRKQGAGYDIGAFEYVITP
jgi:hypothetical protein